MNNEAGIIARLRRQVRDVAPKEDRRMLGIFLVLVALICFTAIDTAAKWLVINGMGTGQTVFLRYGVNLVIIMSLLLPLMGRRLFHTKKLGLEIVRALMLLLSTIFNFIAVKYLSLTLTAAIFFSLPLLMCALSGPFLGEHVGWRRWVAVFVGFLGVLVIVRPGMQGFHWATLLSLGMVVAVAFYNILNRKLAGVDSIFTQQFYAAAVSTLFILPFAFGPLAELAWMWPMDNWGWVAIFSMGIFGTLGHLLLTAAHRYAEASTLAPFVYAQIIWMTVSSWLIFGQGPDIWVWVGVPIVFGSGLYIWNRERKRARQISTN